MKIIKQDTEKEHTQILRHDKKTKYLNYRHKKEEFQVNSIEQIYNKITEENFSK